MPPAELEEQRKHGWNKDDKSPNVYVKDDDLWIHRYPVAQSTDGCRGKVGYSSGLHCWEITWNTRQRGTHAIIGIATRDAPLTCFGYRSLIGLTDDSWGWDITRNKLYHGGKSHKYQRPSYPSFLDNDQVLDVPEKVKVVLDMDAGTLSFVASDQYLGVAFTGLKGKTLYPVVSSVWGNCEVGIRYINGLEPKPLSLSELCRRRVRKSMTTIDEQTVDKLPVPHLIRSFILYRNRFTPQLQFPSSTRLTSKNQSWVCNTRL